MPGTPPAPEGGGVLPGGKGVPPASKDVPLGDDEAAPARRDGGAATVGTGAGPAGGDRAELERFRTEAAQLRRQRSGNKRQRSGGWRTPVATLLIVVGCLLAPVSVLTVWTANQVSNTDRYVANIEPLIHDPAIQNALTDKITTQIISHLNVAGHANQAAAELTSHGLPRVGALVKTFAPQVAGAIAGFIHTQVHKIVTSPAAAHLWVQANRAAHEQIVQALSGQGGGAISTSNGQVVLDLAPFINVIKQDLVNRGFSLIGSLPTIHVTIALFSSRTLVEAQTLYRLLNDLKWVLPILALVLIGLGVYIARHHRRALIGAGLGLAASMVVLGALPPTRQPRHSTPWPGSSNKACACCWSPGCWSPPAPTSPGRRPPRSTPAALWRPAWAGSGRPASTRACAPGRRAAGPTSTGPAFASPRSRSSA